MIGAMTLARVDHPADPDLDGEDLSGAFFFPQGDCHHPRKMGYPVFQSADLIANSTPY
jgi:hypothetical protein